MAGSGGVSGSASFAACGPASLATASSCGFAASSALGAASASSAAGGPSASAPPAPAPSAAASVDSVGGRGIDLDEGRIEPIAGFHVAVGGLEVDVAERQQSLDLEAAAESGVGRAPVVDLAAFAASPEFSAKGSSPAVTGRAGVDAANATIRAGRRGPGGGRDPGRVVRWRRLGLEEHPDLPARIDQVFFWRSTK